MINAVRYLVRSGCGWRMLPIHFGAWQTIYGWFRELARRFLFQTIHDVALMVDRERAGREASPSAAVIDSQSVKAPQAETRGYDAGKKIVGRKRHIAVDTDGRLLMVNLTTADISDSAGAQMILDTMRKRWPWVKHLFADGAYDRQQLMDKAAFLEFVVEIIRRSDDQKGFQVLPRRWVVERTFGWMMRWRRLVRDYEQRIDVSLARISHTMSFDDGLSAKMCGRPGHRRGETAPAGSEAFLTGDVACCVDGRVDRGAHAAADSLAYVRAHSRWKGQAEFMASLMRRTETLTRAPILNSLRRMVAQLALASLVLARPMRRSAQIST